MYALQTASGKFLQLNLNNYILDPEPFRIFPNIVTSISLGALGLVSKTLFLNDPISSTTGICFPMSMPVVFFFVRMQYIGEKQFAAMNALGQTWP